MEGRIQDYILAEEILTPVVPAEAKPKKKSAITYTPVVENGMDLVLERKSSRGTRLAAFIMSQGQFYIKDENGETEMMDEKNLSRFLSSAEEPVVLTETFWLKDLRKGINFSRALVSFLKFNELVKEGLTTFDVFMNTSGQGRYRAAELEEMLQASAQERKILKYVLSKACEVYEMSLEEALAKTLQRGFRRGAEHFLETHINSIMWASLFQEQYGPDKARKLIDTFAERNICIGLNSDTYIDLISMVDEDLKERVYAGYQQKVAAAAQYFKDADFRHNKECFDPDRLIAYMAACHEEGFTDLQSLVCHWRDTLKNQKLIYGKIVDKYPENLYTEHARTSLKAAEVEEIRQIKEFSVNYESTKELEWENGNYVFIVPKEPSDMVDEAFAQRNCICLRSYIPDVALGNKRIVFMRGRKAPGKSLITIEVRSDNSIGKVKGRYNRNASTSEMAAVRAWADEKGLACFV